MMLHRCAFLHQLCTDVAWDVNRFMNALNLVQVYIETSHSDGYLDVLGKNVKCAELFVTFFTSKHPLFDVEVVLMCLCQVFSH